MSKPDIAHVIQHTYTCTYTGTSIRVSEGVNQVLLLDSSGNSHDMLVHNIKTLESLNILLAKVLSNHGNKGPSSGT